jgi:hypothetical protein
MKHLSFLLSLAALTIVSFEPAQGVTEITLDHADGLRGGDPVVAAPQFDSAIILDTVYGMNSSGELPAATNLKFMMRWVYLSGYYPIHRFANGFRVYSPDGATWQPIVLDTMSHSWTTRFDLIIDINYWSANGSGADTAGIWGDVMMGSGIPAPFDTLVWWIETKVYQADIGKHLCIDSSYQPSVGYWVWEEEIGSSLFPGWSGPHCFEIAACCNGDGVRGNVDNLVGPAGEVDVADLTYLVGYLFQSGTAPPCEDEANVDAIVGPGGPIDVADLTYLVAYLFQAGSAPAACP